MKTIGVELANITEYCTKRSLSYIQTVHLKLTIHTTGFIEGCIRVICYNGDGLENYSEEFQQINLSVSGLEKINTSIFWTFV